MTLVGAGVTLHEAISAAELAGGVRHTRSRDRPVLDQADRRGHPRKAARTPATSSRSRTTGPKAALGEAVLAALADADVHPRVSRLAVTHMPGSATPEEQLAEAGIDAAAIVDAAQQLLSRPLPLVGAEVG